jgi:pyruvate,water dikinase
MGVSPGKVEGRARVILDPRTGAHIEPGEILVAPVTDAGWTPLFITAAGLVVEVGGLLSHGSVVAREYGLPAAVGVTGATAEITTGDRIYLDGSSGIVVKLDTADDGTPEAQGSPCQMPAGVSGPAYHQCKPSRVADHRRSARPGAQRTTTKHPLDR